MSDLIANILLFFVAGLFAAYMVTLYCIAMKYSNQNHAHRVAKKARKKEKKRLKKLALTNANAAGAQPQS